MLAEGGGRVAGGGARAVEADRIAQRFVAADDRMIDAVDQRAAGIGAQRLAHAAHQRGGHAGATARVDPPLCPPRGEHLFQNADQRGPLFHPLRVRGETAVGGQLRPPHHPRAEQRKVAVRPATDHKRPVAPVKELVRHDRRMRAPPPRRLPPGQQRVLRHVHQRCHRRSEQRDLDRRPLAVPLPRAKRRADRAERVVRGEDIRERDAGLHRFPVSLAVDGHQARLRLGEEVVAGRGVVETGDPAMDRAGVARQAQREEVVDDDVRALDEPLRRVHPDLALQVQGQRFLVPIDREEIRADATYERRTPAAGLVAAAGLLHFDHPRAGVGEELRREGAGEHAGEIGDQDAVERTFHRYCCLRASSSARVRRRMATTLWISEP